MSDEPIRKLTPEEVEETNRQAAEYLKKLDAIEASGKTPINSPKFDGPIGTVVDEENLSAEAKEANQQIDEFLKSMDAVPESERIQINSDKFDEPIGLVETPENAPNDSDKSDPNSNQAA